MKKVVLLTVLAVAFIKADAMSYEQARDQALFLTDKMAYELNLTPEQYDAAYEVNLDYLMGVTTADDVFGTYWEHRNVDFGYILLDWQYRTFMDCLWFYRPLYWDSGFWHFRIYGRYPHRDWFYFEQRTIVITYTGGGHCWRTHGSSWYCGRTFGHPDRIGSGGSGMRNNWNGHGHRYASTSQFKGSNGSNGSRDSRVEGRGTFSGSGNHSGSFSGSGNHSGSFSRSTDSRHQGTDVGQRVTSGRTGNTTSSEHNYSRGSSFSSGTTNSHTGSSRSSLTSNQSIREKVKSLPNVERVRVGTLSGSSRSIYSGQSSKVGSSSYSNSPRSSSSSQRSTNSLSSGRGSGRGSFSSSSSSQRSTSSLSSGRVSGRGSFSSGSFSGGRSGGGFSGGHSGGGRR